jgi:hypothetical protein
MSEPDQKKNSLETQAGTLRVGEAMFLSTRIWMGLAPSGT